MIDLPKMVLGHALPCLQWLPIIYRIESTLLNLIYKALWAIALTLLPASSVTISTLFFMIWRPLNAHIISLLGRCYPWYFYNTPHLDSGLHIFVHKFSTALLNLLPTSAILNSHFVQPGWLVTPMLYSWSSHSTKSLSLSQCLKYQIIYCYVLLFCSELCR